MIQTPVIVTFANQKGGVGKTILCVTFANYLVAKGVRVVIIDCDFQHLIMKCRKADIKKYGEEQLPYEVWSYEPNNKVDRTSLVEKLHNDPEIDVVLIDSPEEDVDISDEAQSFRPHKVSREEPKKEEEKKEESEAQSDADASQEGKEESDDEKEQSDNSEETSNEAELDTEQDETSSQSSDDETTEEPAKEAESEKPSDEQASEESNDDAYDEEHSESNDHPFCSPSYREAIMTDGILVDDIFKVIDQLAETGECDLDTIIYHCESMRYAG